MACGRPFRVSEQVRPISEKLTARTIVKGLAVEATAVTDEDELMRLFNANMILARILVVKLTLKNQSPEPVDTRRLEFDLRDARGHEFEYFRPREAVDKLYKYYEIKNYLITAREKVEADFEQGALQPGNDLGPGQERRGFVFFQIPEEVDNLSPLGDLSLRLERLRWPKSDRDTTIELRLSR